MESRGGKKGSLGPRLCRGHQGFLGGFQNTLQEKDAYSACPPLVSTPPKRDWVWGRDRSEIGGTWVIIKVS